MGLLARFMSTACQKLNGPAYQYNCTVFFINQIREKIGVMYGGNPISLSNPDQCKEKNTSRIKIAE